MGMGNIYTHEKIIIKISTINCKRIELAPPNNEKANIGLYLLSPKQDKESKTLESWNNLLRNYKTSKPIEELLKDTKNFRILTNYIRLGVPMKWRWETWKSYINLFVIPETEYKSIPYDNLDINSVIKKDVNRTFPEHKYFDKERFGFYGQFALMRVLGKFARSYPEIEYCQGMNFIVGFLLMISGGDEIETFSMIEAVIHHFGIKTFYTENMPGLKSSLLEFEVLFQKNSKALYWHFRENEIYEDMWILKWFITLFTAVLPLPTTLNVWDILMVDGISALPQIALSIIKYFEYELLQKDSAEILQFLNNLKFMEIDSNKLLHPAIVHGRKSKSKPDTKIFPFSHPRSNESSIYEIPEPDSPTKLIMHCQITEDPSDLPFLRSQSLTQKNYAKIKYRPSFNIEDTFEASTMVEDSKNDENFDAHNILNDLTAEDYE